MHKLSMQLCSPDQDNSTMGELKASVSCVAVGDNLLASALLSSCGGDTLSSRIL